MQTSRAPQSYWDDSYDGLALEYRADSVEFRELLRRHLPGGGTSFEVGIYPGPYSIFLGRELGYTVSGIDLTPFVSSRLPQHFEAHGVAVGDLVRGDFLEFECSERYDVVCSFGFIEHFENFEEVLRKHIALLKPHGTLVVSCPNFRGLQWVGHWLFDRENLQRHATRAMNLRRWQRVLDEHGMVRLHHGYHRTADFWVDKPPRSRAGRWGARAVTGLARAVDAAVERPNRLTSPHMVSISRRAAA
jgi:SAM-dependent methyltransferase